MCGEGLFPLAAEWELPPVKSAALGQVTPKLRLQWCWYWTSVCILPDCDLQAGTLGKLLQSLQLGWHWQQGGASGISSFCSSLQEFPACGQKCLKPHTYLQRGTTHCSSLGYEWVLQEWLMPWASTLGCWWRAWQDWPLLGASLQLSSQWAQPSAREQNSSWVGEAWTMPAKAVCSPWEAVLAEIGIYKALLHNYLRVYWSLPSPASFMAWCSPCSVRTQRSQMTTASCNNSVSNNRSCCSLAIVNYVLHWILL